MAYDINDLFVGNEETSKRISEGIEKNRKGNFSVKVLPGDSVTVKTLTVTDTLNIPGGTIWVA